MGSCCSSQSQNVEKTKKKSELPLLISFRQIPFYLDINKGQIYQRRKQNKQKRPRKQTELAKLDQEAPTQEVLSSRIIFSRKNSKESSSVEASSTINNAFSSKNLSTSRGKIKEKSNIRAFEKKIISSQEAYE